MKILGYSLFAIALSLVFIFILNPADKGDGLPEQAQNQPVLRNPVPEDTDHSAPEAKKALQGTDGTETEAPLNAAPEQQPPVEEAGAPKSANDPFEQRSGNVLVAPEDDPFSSADTDFPPFPSLEDGDMDDFADFPTSGFGFDPEDGVGNTGDLTMEDQLQRWETGPGEQPQ